jgi:hypothetical protein
MSMSEVVAAAPGIPAPAALPDINTISREEALAEIEQLKGDKSFYDRLQKQDASAHQRWSGLHKAAHPAQQPSSVEAASAQASARDAQAMDELIAHYRSLWDLTPEQESELRGTRWQGGRVIREEDYRRAVDLKDRLIRDAGFRKKLLIDQDRGARELWGRVQAQLGMRPVKVA